MNTLISFGHNTFASLKVRNYRLYFIGQGISQCGNWMQTVALGWLVLELTNSGTALGGVLAVQFFPMLFGGLLGGRIVDRFDKRTLMYWTQSLLGVVALVISFLVFTHLIQIWMLYVSAFVIGCLSAVDNPARQTFLHELVGREHLKNAVSLASTEANLARAVGPFFAGVLIASLGIATCFAVNAISFIAVIIVLYFIRASELHKEPRVTQKTDVKKILSYVASEPRILTILIMMALIGTFTYEFQVSLPLLAHSTFAGTAADYAALLSMMGIGSAIGGLYSAGRSRVTVREVSVYAILFGLSMCVTSLMPTMGLATLGMFFVGFFSINFNASGNTIVQLESAPELRGSVMSLWMMAHMGSTLIGAPIIGLIGQYASARSAFALGGVVAVVVGTVVAYRLKKVVG